MAKMVKRTDFLDETNKDIFKIEMMGHHCKDFKYAINEGYVWVEEDLRERKYFYAIGNDGHQIAYKTDGLKIKHCPFCGKKLK